MITYSNIEVWPEGKGAPSLVDIAVGLGRIPRFCGHTREWYPVLPHMLVCAQVIKPKFGLYGLLHDSQETCMSDVPTPWKTEAARRREVMLLRRIYLANGLVTPISDKAQDAVDIVDSQVLVAEAHVIGHPRAEIFGIPDPQIVELVEEQLPLAQKYINPKKSIPAFMEAWDKYLALLPKSAKVPVT